MSVYLINIISIMGWGSILLTKNTNKTKKMLFCMIATLQWIILSGLRHISIGADTYAYKVYRFTDTMNSSWSEILTEFYNVVFLGMEGKDPGYSIIEKIFQMFTDNYQIFLIFIAIVFTVPMGIFIYKYSKKPCLSFIIYSCLFYSFFAITGHRQTIATGIAVFLGYELIKQRKFWQFTFMVLIMSTIHKSAMCLIPFYFIATKQITKKYSIFMLSCFVVMFIFKNKVMSFLAIFMGYENYANQYEGAGSWNFTTIFIVVIITALYRLPKIMEEKNLDITIWYNAAFVALLLLPLTFVDPNAMRVVQYFSIFIILLIPEIIASFACKERTLIYYISISLMIVLLARRNPQYLFFWQGGF